MEEPLVKIHYWLYPVSWIYGMGVYLRNKLFDWGYYQSKSFDVPVVCVGNLAVGGTGKTPHTEYLIKLLQQTGANVAMLSRGYKRKSKGYVLATEETDVKRIGDEPYQIKTKFPDIRVAVDENRCHGIEQLMKLDNPKVDVVLLDDAYQHRHVKAGLNILLTDFHRLFSDDTLLPAGRLREPEDGKNRAHIVIVTKCPEDIKPMGFRVISKALKLYPYQKLFFSTLKYSRLIPLFGEEEYSLDELLPHKHVLLLTGIASPEQMKMDLEHYETDITPLSFGDHHYFSAKDVALINETYARMSSPKLIVTTEKDATRLKDLNGLSEEVRKSLYALPVEIEILQNQQESFNENITGYVFKNSRNSILAKK